MTYQNPTYCQNLSVAFSHNTFFGETPKNENSRKLRLDYYLFGFKGCGLNYFYREKIPNETSFSNYVNTTLEYKEITNSRANLDFGFGISYQWFFLVNFRTGYLLPLEDVRWNINNNQDKLGSAPTLSYNYYFTLTIGLGNIASDDELRRHYNRNQ